MHAPPPLASRDMSCLHARTPIIIPFCEANRDPLVGCGHWPAGQVPGLLRNWPHGVRWGGGELAKTGRTRLVWGPFWRRGPAVT